MEQMSHSCQDGSQDTSDAEHAFVLNLTLHHTPELYILIRILFHFNASNISSDISPGRYVLKIHFFIEFGQKMIQFKI